MSTEKITESTLMPSPKRAVLYLRVSTERQARKGSTGGEGYSIPAQREICERQAEALGAEVVAEYLDAGESARSADRPQLQAMLKRLEERNDIDFVIVHKIDRLARNRRDDTEIVFAIRTAGADLVSCSENVDDTPSGALMHSIMAGIAEFYSRNLSVEVKKGLHQKAKSGGTPGRAPLGYLNVVHKVNGQENRTIETDPERSPLIEWMFHAYASGDYTLSELTEEMDQKGLRTRETTKVPSKAVQRSRIWKMLSNSYYAGIVSYGGVQYEGIHEPLVDLPTWRRVQEVLTQNRTAGDRSQVHQHYLKGSIYCGHCGARMAITHSRGRHGGIFSYFYCLGRNKKRSECQQGYIPLAKVENAVCGYYRHADVSSDELEQIREEVRSHIEISRSLNGKEVTRQERRLRKLDDERRKLLQAHYADAVPLDLMQEEQERIASETHQAERIMIACTAEFDEMDRSLDEALATIDGVALTYLLGGNETRRSLNQALFDKLFIVDEGILGADLAAPFHQLLDKDLAARISEEQSDTGGLNSETSMPAVTYERMGVNDDECVEALLSTIDWHSLERPDGALPVDRKNPSAYCRRRGSNLSLLAERGGFEPPEACASLVFKTNAIVRSAISPPARLAGVAARARKEFSRRRYGASELLRGSRTTLGRLGEVAEPG